MESEGHLWRRSIGRFLSEDPVLVNPSYTPLVARNTSVGTSELADRQPASASPSRPHIFRPRLTRSSMNYYTSAADNPIAFADPSGELTHCQKVGLGAFGSALGILFLPWICLCP